MYEQMELPPVAREEHDGVLWSIHARLHFLRMQGLFREAVLALWAADHADLKFGRALIRAIQARCLLALVADERVVGMFAVSRLACAP